MANKVAINGFGRIGRVALRIISERLRNDRSPLDVVAINDPASAEELAFLFEFDSVHRRFSGTVSYDKESITIDGRRIHVFSSRDPLTLPWKSLQIDTVLESSGHFLTREKASLHLESGAQKVLISAPGKGALPDATICYGVNHQDYRPDMRIVSTASCTTNCIAPIAAVLEKKFGIDKAMVTTIHSYTNDQNLLDLHHSDRRRARAAALSMIPTSTGAAEAISLIIPKLKGKFEGSAVRVPTPNVSLIDMVVVLEKKVDKDAINQVLKEAAMDQYKGIMEYEERPLVSVDFLGTSASSVVDAMSTMVLDNQMAKIMAWYDNEWGFTNRAIDILEMMSA